MNREDLAIRYYQDLIELDESNKEHAKKISKRARKIGKERFVREYPLSLLDIVSYRTFWEMCFDLKIVEKPFYYDEERNSSFEKKLYDIISSLVFFREKSGYSKEDVINLFKKYKYLS